jgi:hypothetical protein
MEMRFRTKNGWSLGTERDETAGGWREVHNSQTSFTYINGVMKSRRIRWAE